MKIRFWLVLALLVPLSGMAATNNNTGMVTTPNTSNTPTNTTQYVSDHLVITLRTGQGNQYQIVKTLPSGTVLTVLQQTPTGYSQVRTSDGTEGWVRSQYLSNDPPAALVLGKTQDKLAKVQDKLKQMEKTLGTLRKQKSQLDSQYGKLQNEHKTTTAELTKLSQIASHPQELESENVDLRQKFTKMSNEYALLKQENQVLKDRSKRNWFLIGAFVAFIGIGIGLIIPKLRFRRKDGWDF